MLKIGSCIDVYDNSGAIKIQIVNLRIKKTYKSAYISAGYSCLGVVKKDNTFESNAVVSSKKKTLKRKDLVEVLITCVKKKTSRKNGIYIQFDNNVGIPFEFKNKRNQPLATRIFSPISKEIEKKKIYKYLVLKAKRPL